jgi:hypothetical protein
MHGHIMSVTPLGSIYFIQAAKKTNIGSFYRLTHCAHIPSVTIPKTVLLSKTIREYTTQKTLTHLRLIKDIHQFNSVFIPNIRYCWSDIGHTTFIRTCNVWSIQTRRQFTSVLLTQAVQPIMPLRRQTRIK